VRKCAICEASIKECFGSVNAGDFVKACEGELPWTSVRELCPKCTFKKIVESDYPELLTGYSCNNL
jgi:hypothetical protein